MELRPSDERVAPESGWVAQIRLKFGRVLAFQTRTARNRRVGDASRPGTGLFRAASAQFSRLWTILALERLNRDFSEWRHRTAPIEPRPSFSEFLDGSYSQAKGMKRVNKPLFFQISHTTTREYNDYFVFAGERVQSRVGSVSPMGSALYFTLISKRTSTVH